MARKRDPAREETLRIVRDRKQQLADRDALIARKTGQVLLVVMGVTLALPMLFRGTPMQRNTYNTREDCERDYLQSQCEPGSHQGYSGQRYWNGPWYPEDPARRKPGEAGRTHSLTGPTTQSNPGYRGVEYGTRGGFGSTGRVRAIGS